MAAGEVGNRKNAGEFGSWKAQQLESLANKKFSSQKVTQPKRSVAKKLRSRRVQRLKTYAAE